MNKQLKGLMATPSHKITTSKNLTYKERMVLLSIRERLLDQENLAIGNLIVMSHLKQMAPQIIAALEGSNEWHSQINLVSGHVAEISIENNDLEGDTLELLFTVNGGQTQHLLGRFATGQTPSPEELWATAYNEVQNYTQYTAVGVIPI